MVDKPTGKVHLQLDKVVYNLRGEAAKDMIDALPNADPAKAPDLTIGSLIANGLMIGTDEDSIKQALKHFQLSKEIHDAEVKEGFIEVDDAKISQIEEAYGRIKHPMFKAALYAGSVLEELNRCKIEILRSKQQPLD